MKVARPSVCAATNEEDPLCNEPRPKVSNTGTKWRQLVAPLGHFIQEANRAPRASAKRGSRSAVSAPQPYRVGTRPKSGRWAQSR